MSKKKRKEKTILERIPKDKKYDDEREKIKELIKYQPSIEDLLNKTYFGIKEKGVWRI